MDRKTKIEKGSRDCKLKKKKIENDWFKKYIGIIKNGLIWIGGGCKGIGVDR